jgi:hypothetical protein
MVDYDERMGEKFPGYNPEKEKRGEYADVWEGANMMEDAPEFQGDDPYNPSIVEEQDQFNAGYDEYGRPVDAEGHVIEQDEKKQAVDADRYETRRPVDRGYGGAEKLSSYGLDTAARMYGLNAVLKAVNETDESDRDAYNPMGSIYSRLVPNPDERRNLYNQIQKDSVVEDADDDVPDGENRQKLGFDEDTGDFFAVDEYDASDAFRVTAADELAKRETNTAVREMKKLLDALQHDARFEKVRERAAAEGKDVISYITTGDVNPTITSFFDGLDSANGASAEDILDTIEQNEAAKEVEEAQEKAAANEEISDEEKADALAAAEKLKNASLDEFNGLNPDMLK